LQTEHVEQRDDDVGVTRPVGRVFQDRRLGLVVDDLVEHVGRVPHRGGNALVPYCETWSEVQA